MQIEHVEQGRQVGEIERHFSPHIDRGPFSPPIAPDAVLHRVYVSQEDPRLRTVAKVRDTGDVLAYVWEDHAEEDETAIRALLQRGGKLL